MNEKVKKELDRLIRDEEELNEKFQEIKKEFSEFILKSDSNMISKMNKFTVYSRLMDTINELNELEIKIRTLNFAMVNQ